MIQGEMDFGTTYNIFTDQEEPIREEDVRVWKETFRAYGKVRQAANEFRGFILCHQLDKIHDELKQRIQAR